LSANGTGAKRYVHPEVQDLAAAVEVAFRGVRRDLSTLAPGAVVEVVRTAAGAGDVVVGNPLRRIVSVCLPVMWRGVDSVAYHLKTNTDRQLVIHVAGPCDASFWVR
jgi:hypothetical protein